MLGEQARDALIDALLPARCLNCRRPAAAAGWGPFLCSRCSASLPLRTRPTCVAPGLWIWAPMAFEGPARVLLHALKYHGATLIGRRLGQQIAMLLEETAPQIVVPVPLHWRRRWVRGHNQALTLARGVARELPSVRVMQVLRRVRATAPQVGLGARRRRANLRDAFAVEMSRLRRIEGLRVVLLDDVVTTGSTMLEAAATLRGEGALEILLAAAAVVPPIRQLTAPRSEPATQASGTQRSGSGLVL